MYKLKMNNPGLPSGAEVQIRGLGIVRNGHEEIIDDERALAFRGANQTQETVVATSEGTLVATEDSPTLLQVFKDHPFISVEVYKPAQASPSAVDKKQGEGE